MNTNQNKMIEQLAQSLHITNVEALIKAVASPTGEDGSRRRTNAALTAVSSAGRFKYLHWAVLCILIALGLVAAGTLLPAATLILGPAGVAMFALGMIMILLVDPKAVVANVESYIRYTDESLKQWANNARRNASECKNRLTAELATFPGEHLAAGVSACTIRGVLADVATVVDQLLEQARLQLETLDGAISALEGKSRNLTGQLRSMMRGSVVRISPTRIRRPARIVIDGREQWLAHKRDQALLVAVVEEVLEPVRRSVASLLSQWEAEIIDPLTLQRHEADRTLTALKGMGGRDIYGKVLPSEKVIAEETATVIAGVKGTLFRKASENADGHRLISAITQYIENALEESAAMPRTIMECIESLNGGWESFLAQLDAEATEFAITRPIPGREQRRIRTVMVTGGVSSPLFSPIRARSEGCTCRAIDHDRDDEVIVVTEERYQPGVEFMDLVQASQALISMPLESKAAMVVAVDDDDLILTQCIPDQRVEANRGFRLLCLGLALGGVRRNGDAYHIAECVLVREPDINGASRLGKGIEAASATLQTDERLAATVGRWLKHETAVKGVDQVNAAIKAALSDAKLVPAIHTERVRKLLAEEVYCQK